MSPVANYLQFSNLRSSSLSNQEIGHFCIDGCFIAGIKGAVFLHIFPDKAGNGMDKFDLGEAVFV